MANQVIVFLGPDGTYLFPLDEDLKVRRAEWISAKKITLHIGSSPPKQVLESLGIQYQEDIKAEASSEEKISLPNKITVFFSDGTKVEVEETETMLFLESFSEMTSVLTGRKDIAYIRYTKIQITPSTTTQ